MPSRGLRLRPVSSLKHIVDVPTSAILAVVSTIPVITAVDNPSLANVAEVKQGSTVNAIYLRVEVMATNQFSGVARVYLSVFKDPGDNLGMPNPNGSGPDDRKKFIIHQEMILLAGTLSGTPNIPRTMFQGVIRIPPRLKRFGSNDRLEIGLQNGAGETTGITNACVQCIYKEFN